VRKLRLTVLHDDDAFIAVVKPGGLPTVPDESRDPSLLDVVQDSLGTSLHVVHRLDRPVSGIVLLARNSASAAALSKALRDRSVTKTYWGVTEGIPLRSEGTLVQHLVKDTERNKVRSVSERAAGAKRAETHWRVLYTLGDRALLELIPVTGRSHQLRLVAAHLGCPFVGDRKYGASRVLKDLTLGLHARELSLRHPVSGRPVHLTAPLPESHLWNMGRRWLEQSGAG
jgi:23S rRNA pseudouridine1911/1915/1917 synthase